LLNSYCSITTGWSTQTFHSSCSSDLVISAIPIVNKNLCMPLRSAKLCLRGSTAADFPFCPFSSCLWKKHRCGPQGKTSPEMTNLPLVIYSCCRPVPKGREQHSSYRESRYMSVPRRMHTIVLEHVLTSGQQETAITQQI
jgi:hypothetical protein